MRALGVTASLCLLAVSGAALADGDLSGQGFSTGRWEGNMLPVETTHIKHGYHRRNGVPQSDPEFLCTPYIASSSFKKLPDGADWSPTPCVSEWGPLPVMEDTGRFD